MKLTSGCSGYEDFVFPVSKSSAVSACAPTRHAAFDDIAVLLLPWEERLLDVQTEGGIGARSGNADRQLRSSAGTAEERLGDEPHDRLPSAHRPPQACVEQQIAGKGDLLTAQIVGAG